MLQPSGFSNIESITKYDQLDDQIALDAEIEGEHQRIRKAALIIVAVDIGRHDEVPMVIDHLGYVDRKSVV